MDRDPPDARHRCVDAVVHQNVVVGWEAATAPATAAAPRVVSVRTLVQTPRGATLRSLRPRFAAGLGGRLGSGRHWLSWIDIVDLIEVCRSTLGDPALSGPVNAVAGSPFRNPRYSRWPARILHRPALLALAGPGMGPTLLLGERWAQGLATASQRVVPCQLIEAGNRFRRAVLELCLPHELGHLVEETP